MAGISYSSGYPNPDGNLAGGLSMVGWHVTKTICTLPAAISNGMMIFDTAVDGFRYLEPSIAQNKVQADG